MKRAEARIAIISMPWHNPFVPSIQLGALKAFLERELPVVVDTFHYYLECAELIGLPIATAIATDGMLFGDAVFAYHLFPEKRNDILSYLNELKSSNPALDGVDVLADIVEPLGEALNRRANSVDWSAYECIGFSLVFSQILASGLMATLIKERAPRVPIIVGGPHCAGEPGESLLRTFKCFDFLCNGEGELPLTEFVGQLLTNGSIVTGIPGIRPTLDNSADRSSTIVQLRCLDTLPIPDYSPYFATVDELVTRSLVSPNIALPIEGSRGCWWDRSHRDPMMSCSFCNLNTQWHGYREKSVKQTVNEVSVLVDRHKITNLLFVDNILRYSNVPELAEGLRSLDDELQIGLEARVSVKPRELAMLRTAGVRYVQFGIEALSTSILGVINKGTKCIQNIQAMKFCAQFGIINISNIITYHPGVPVHALWETLENLQFATCYSPLRASRFSLAYNSPAYKNQSVFGITSVRNHDSLARFLPELYAQGLCWDEKSFEYSDTDNASGLWIEIEEALLAWDRMYAAARLRCQKNSLLTFERAVDGITITDYRNDPATTTTLDPATTGIYEACAEIKSRTELEEGWPGVSRDELSDILTALCRQKIMFCEGSRYLSLATPAIGGNATAWLDKVKDISPLKVSSPLNVIQT